VADEKIRYVLDVDDKGTPKIVKFGTASEKSGKQAEKSFDKASKSVKEFGQELPVVGRAMSALATPAAAVGAAIAAVGIGMGASVKKSIDFADNIAKMSARLGVSTEQMSSFAHIADLSGVDIESVATAMGKLGAKLSDGDKELAKYKLTATSVDGALYQIADRIKATEDPMLRLKIATDAFGKSGQNMIPMLVQGGDALREMSSHAPVVSAEMGKLSEKFNDTWTDIGGSLRSVSMDIATIFLPALQSAADVAKDIASSIRSASSAIRDKGIVSAVTSSGDEARARNALDASEKKLAWLQKNGGTDREIATARENVVSWSQILQGQRVGSSAGPGGMGGYRGEDIVPGGKDVIGAGATTKAGAARTFAESYQFGSARADYMGSLGLNPYAGGAMSSMSVDGSRNYAGGESVDLGPDYYAGLPLSDKATASVIAKEKEAEKVEAETLQKRIDAQQAQYKAFADSVRGDLQSGFGTAFQDIWRNGRDVFSSLYDAFSEQFTNRAISSLATVFSNLIIPGGGGGGILGLLGFASGGNPPAGVPSVVGERRAEMLIPQGPSRVSPTSGAGMVVNITVSNPAEARSTVRQLQKDGRTRSRGIR
jgi:hypothetical protein